MRLFEYTALQIKAKVLSEEIRATDLIQQVVDRIKDVEPNVQAYITTNEINALKKAQEIEKKITNKEKVGLLAGVAYCNKRQHLHKKLIYYLCLQDPQKFHTSL